MKGYMKAMLDCKTTMSVKSLDDFYATTNENLGLAGEYEGLAGENLGDVGLRWE